MSDILNLQSELNDTAQAVALAEKMLSDNPASNSAKMQLASIVRRQRELEARFLSVAEATGVSICSYRFFADIVRPTIMSFCPALADFQSMYSIVYDAIKTG